ncbi:hydroxymethylglutaryl-CoA lyase [Methylobacterium terricola]|uniref:Hydroxymethylglutaryl-CoA lyase n=1 Tax=Methylobacterium terricola TaxID=2583531 RepID=A0A5C4LHV5_9HYPH|nr:hydroxymethylglutaryl-CoA lyase [Methylobacterium terricola]TNC13018.1 hydroxymethylglutaryl-CoA lyase [Methylobacterium terricola]
MSNLPARVTINEEGPREGFQIEPGPIPTARKIELIDALSRTGLRTIQVGSFVNPKRVPGWADVDAVVEGFRRDPGIRYTAIWLNAQGFERALRHRDRLTLTGLALSAASETFLVKNQNKTLADNVEAQRAQLRLYRDHGLESVTAQVMAAFGCNYEGDVPVRAVVEQAAILLDLAGECGFRPRTLSLADTMGWATPLGIRRVVGAVCERWPDLPLTLHLHDTRGLGLANAFAGLEMGVAEFDASVAGLGGCPFAGHTGAAGNVCTDDLVFLCDELGIETGIDLEALIAASRLAEAIVGHPLPGAVRRGRSLASIRHARAGLTAA